MPNGLNGIPLATSILKFTLKKSNSESSKASSFHHLKRKKTATLNLRHLLQKADATDGLRLI
jgi:hypothetical protein